MFRAVILVMVGAAMLVAGYLAPQLGLAGLERGLAQGVLVGGGAACLALGMVVMLVELVRPGYLEARRRKSQESPWVGVRIVLVIGLPLVVGWMIGGLAGVVIAYVTLIAVIVLGGFFVVPGLRLLSDIVDRVSRR